MINFTAEAFQNEYLPLDGTDVHAVVSISASGTTSGAVADHSAAEVIIVDTSGSMGSDRKIQAAKHATGVAIDCMRDGVEFAVIAGTDRAEQLYPDVGLAVTSATTRDEARRAVARLRARGGTAMSRWLDCANDLFGLLAKQGDAIRHAILLTDGQNEHDDEGALRKTLARCEGKFQCDCRGVGADWEVEELRQIASTLLGTVDIIRDPAEMADDFQAMMENAMGKAASDVALQIWTPQSAELVLVKQVAPAIEDLTNRRSPVDELVGAYPTGAWGNESRDYHICVRVPPRALGEEMLAGRVSVVVGGEVAAQARIRAVWTDDTALSTRINREVAHYRGQAELADVIQDGLEARRAGDEDNAAAKLGRAVQLAAESYDEATMRLLEKVVEIDDAATGTVRLKPKVDVLDEMTLDTRSTITVRVGRGGP